MKYHIYCDKNNIIQLVSQEPIKTNIYKSAGTKNIRSYENALVLIGKKVRVASDSNSNKGIRLAVITNWNSQCGISTYTQFLIDSLKGKVDDIKIFSEIRDQNEANAESLAGKGLCVEYTWKRGKPMTETIKRVLDWKPTVVMIQHEFGLFPRANYFLPMVEMLDASGINTVYTLHSVYEHRDKSVCSAAMKNVVVHSETAKSCLRNTLGHLNQNVRVIPHGCVDYGEVKENWNYFGVEHACMQFGFGFSYKGVDIALEAIAKLKARNEKFKDIFYCYLCSENSNIKNTIDSYYNSLRNNIARLGLENNATIQRGFFSDEELNQHLRTTRLAIYPYVTDPDNVVYGASGAIRIAMANNTPVIASASHMFDDMEGVLPRPLGADELADEIDRIFSSTEYKNNLLARQREYIKNNTWEITAQRYFNFLKTLVDKQDNDVVLVETE